MQFLNSYLQKPPSQERFLTSLEALQLKHQTRLKAPVVMRGLSLEVAVGGCRYRRGLKVPASSWEKFRILDSSNVSKEHKGESFRTRYPAASIRGNSSHSP